MIDEFIEYPKKINWYDTTIVALLITGVFALLKAATKGIYHLWSGKKNAQQTPPIQVGADAKEVLSGMSTVMREHFA